MTRFTLIVSLLIATVVAALAGAASRAEAAAAPLVPAHGTLLGAYVNYKHASGRAGRMNEITRLEHKMGRRYDIDHTYAQWHTPFPTWYEKWDVKMGRIPFVNWKGVSSKSIVAGREDAWIRRRARAVRALGAPIMIQYYGEMDRQAGSPRAFVKAWRRIHHIFASQGARNAVWVWCPTGDGFRTGRAQRYYPGNTQVDWLCADAYNWPGKRWRSFKSSVAPFYHWAVARHSRKPLMIGEFGSREAGRGRKARWIARMDHDLKTTLRHIKAIVYFDTVAGDSGIDWRLQSSRSSMRAWVKLARDPWFCGHAGPVSRHSRTHRRRVTRQHRRHSARHHLRQAAHTRRALRVTGSRVDGAASVTRRHGVDVRYRLSRGGRVTLRVLDRHGRVVQQRRQGKRVAGRSLVASWWGWGRDGRPARPGGYRLQVVLRRSGHVVTGRTVQVKVRAATHG